MQILIKKNAKDLYVAHTAITLKSPVNWDYAAKLEELQGKTLDVETEYLFYDQFNTKDMRIYINSVEKVIDDIRQNKMRCQYCGKTSDIADICPKCQKKEYLQKFDINILKYQWK